MAIKTVSIQIAGRRTTNPTIATIIIMGIISKRARVWKSRIPETRGFPPNNGPRHCVATTKGIRIMNEHSNVCFDSLSRRVFAYLHTTSWPVYFSRFRKSFHMGWIHVGAFESFEVLVFLRNFLFSHWIARTRILWIICFFYDSFF